jgi:hypothetical protein
MIGFLTSRLAGPIAAAGCVALALALLISQVQLRGARHDRDEARSELSAKIGQLAQCHTNTGTLQTAIDEQNAAVIVLERRSEAMAKAQADALAEAANAVTEARSRAERIRAAVPEVGATDCDAAGTLAANILFGDNQ